MLLQHLLPLLVAPLLLEPCPARAEHGGIAVAQDLTERREQATERELGREDDPEKEQRQDQDDRTGPVQVRGEDPRHVVAGVPARVKRLAGDVERFERQRQKGGDAGEEEEGTNELGIDGVERPAPELVPADHHQRERDQIRGVSKELIQELRHERANPPGKVRRRQVAARC